MSTLPPDKPRSGRLARLYAAAWQGRYTIILAVIFAAVLLLFLCGCL
jgi:hypothetical protein